MSRSRRSFTTEYKVEAAHRVIDSGRTVAEVALLTLVMEAAKNHISLNQWAAQRLASE